MFRVSNLLKNTREDKELDYAEISKKLKIPAKYLMAIEAEDIKSFPSEPYCSLIVKDYANYLGLNGEEILSIFRRDFDRKLSTKKSDINRQGITPQFTFGLAIIIAIIGFISYLGLEYLKFNRPPSLTVEWPPASPDMVEIKGKTDSEATVRVNQDLVIVNQDGSFSKKVSVSPPVTKIVVESKSQSGKTTVSEKVY